MRHNLQKLNTTFHQKNRSIYPTKTQNTALNASGKIFEWLHPKHHHHNTKRWQHHAMQARIHHHHHHHHQVATVRSCRTATTIDASIKVKNSTRTLAPAQKNFACAHLASQSSLKRRPTKLPQPAENSSMHLLNKICTAKQNFTRYTCAPQIGGARGRKWRHNKP